MKWENTHNNGQEEVMKMKRKRFFAATALVLAAFMGISVGCAPDDTKDPGSENPGTEEPGENPGTPETPKTYTITFMNGDQVVKKIPQTAIPAISLSAGRDWIRQMRRPAR